MAVSAYISIVDNTLNIKQMSTAINLKANEASNELWTRKELQKKRFDYTVKW